MNIHLPDASLRVLAAAKVADLEINIRQMSSSTRTAKEAAEACDCNVGQIVKSLVFAGQDSDQPYLLLVSGGNRVDEEKVGIVIGEAIKRPDAQFVRDITGYAIGGIPPIGHKSPLKTYIDTDLLQFDTVWAAAGTPDTIFSSNPATLANAANAIQLQVN